MIQKRYITIYGLLIIVLSMTSLQIQAKKQRYTVQVDNLKKIFQVKMCFEESPNYLYATSEGAGKVIGNVKWSQENNAQSLKPQNNRINLPEKQKGCLSYDVGFKNKDKTGKPTPFTKQHPNDGIVPISLWLWRRSDSNNNSETIITFNHVKNVNISTPWKLLQRFETQTNYLMQYTPDDWTGYVAFGEFKVKHIKVHSSTIRLAIINGNNKINQQRYIKWASEMAHAVASIGDEFPLKQVQVMVLVLKGGKYGAVPWGQVNRAGDSGVFFLVNPQKSEAELFEDWTAAHEFSHLLLPSTDRWLSEGFASYYQNISRARTQLIDEKTAWENLIAGILRGEKSSKQSDAHILGSHKDMKRMQLYWGGAAFALMADVNLQEQTHGAFSLSKSLKEFERCCLQSRREWSDKEIFIRLDEISKTSVFTNLYQQEVMQKTFPEFHQTLEKLGIHIDKTGDISLDSDIEKSELRKMLING